MRFSPDLQPFSYPDWLDQRLFPFPGKLLSLAGHSIHYIDEGEGPVLLFAHPAIGWSFMYRNLIKILRRNYRCIALDFPGYGFSKAAKNYTYSLREQSEVLELFIRQFSLKDIILLGHDTGGPSAFFLAARRPDLFKAFILTDTLIFPATDYSRINTMLAILASTPIRLLNRSTNFLMRLSCRFGFYTKKLTAPEKQAYLQVFNTPEKRDRLIRTLTGIRRETALMETVQKAFETTLQDRPSLLIYGEKDPLQQVGIPDRIRRLLSNAELHYIPKEGHFPHEGAAEVMADLIHDWIQRI